MARCAHLHVNTQKQNTQQRRKCVICNEKDKIPNDKLQKKQSPCKDTLDRPETYESRWENAAPQAVTTALPVPTHALCKVALPRLPSRHGLGCGPGPWAGFRAPPTNGMLWDLIRLPSLALQLLNTPEPPSEEAGASERGDGPTGSGNGPTAPGRPHE